MIYFYFKNVSYTFHHGSKINRIVNLIIYNKKRKDFKILKKKNICNKTHLKLYPLILFNIFIIFFRVGRIYSLDEFDMSRVDNTRIIMTSLNDIVFLFNK